jgi:hypothetical protein
VNEDIEHIRRERLAWSPALTTMLGAGASFCQGRRDAAMRGLELAASQFEQVDMRLYVEASRRRLGALVGRTAGQDMIRSADAWMTTQQVKNPSAMVRLLVPGFPD